MVYSQSSKKRSIKHKSTGKKLKHHLSDLQEQITGLEEQNEKMETLRQTLLDEESEKRPTQEEEEGVPPLEGLTDGFFKQARIQKLVHKEDRSQLQNFQTMKWLTKRTKETKA